MFGKINLYRKSKYACLLIGMLGFASISKGAPVDSITAKTVASNFYAQLYGVKTLSLIYTEQSSQGVAEYYVYNVHPDSGFVIVSADDAAYPIIGYSAEGYYHLTNTPPDFTLWMQNYKKQIDYIKLNNVQASVDIQNKWSEYKNNVTSKAPKRITINSVAPLVNTVWAQSPYYNALCPGGSLAGCVATAMGQIMKYWSYPPHGISSHSYTDSPYGALIADFDSTHYDWAAMPLNVTRNNPQVATLMYDCGVGVDMSYSPSSSGSEVINGDDTVCAQNAFIKYFGYNSSSMQGLYRSNYGEANWLSMLENELNNKRPLLYVGYGDSGGHAWVCDGYDINADFHMNWGWEGYEDGYYNINSLNPAGLPLNSGQEALIGIEPAPAVAHFSATITVIRAGDTVSFKDNSIGYAPITAWQWSFPGAVSTSSTAQNPIAIYNTAGAYSVSETVANSEGNNTLTLNNYVLVLENNIVNAYPTLNNGTFNVQLQNATLANSNIVFSLYDFLGQKIYSTTLHQYITLITVNVPHGMYFFRAFDSSGNPVSTGKLIMK